MLKILQLAFKSAGIFLFLYASPTFAELNLLKQLGTALENVQIELNKIEQPSTSAPKVIKKQSKKEGASQSGNLRSAFNKLSSKNRKVIQEKLLSLGFYRSTIDGLYGKGTAKALNNYNKNYLQNSDLSKIANMNYLFETLSMMDSSSSETTTAISKGRLIPEDQCALITSASKDESVILDKLVNYTFFSDPLGVKSNNGYIATSIGIVQKSDSQNILREFKSKGLIPGDSYCANEIRFVSLLVPNYNFTQLDEVSFENLIKEVRTNPLAESKKPTFTSALSQCPSSGFFHMCFGTRIYDHGEIYVGEWIDDLSHGQGRLTYRDGSVEEGYWERGEFTMVANLSLPRCPTSLNVNSWDNCNGGYSSKSGDWYNGQWVKGARHGPGFAAFANGDQYQGWWEKDEINGTGTFTYADGSTKKGIWAKGELVGEAMITDQSITNDAAGTYDSSQCGSGGDTSLTVEPGAFIFHESYCEVVSETTDGVQSKIQALCSGEGEEWSLLLEVEAFMSGNLLIEVPEESLSTIFQFCTPLASEEAAEQIEAKELELVVSYANSLFSEDCNQFKDAFSYVKFNKKYQIGDYVIYEILCRAAAYNGFTRWFKQVGDGSFAPISFPMPNLEKTSSGQFIIAGFRDEIELVNSEFDYKTQSVISINNWTGSGEASERGEWEFRGGSFVFSKYLVDETYDGQVNPILVGEE